jgi:hypothetical protein
LDVAGCLSEVDDCCRSLDIEELNAELTDVALLRRHRVHGFDLTEFVEKAANGSNAVVCSQGGVGILLVVCIHNDLTLKQRAEWAVVVATVSRKGLAGVRSNPSVDRKVCRNRNESVSRITDVVEAEHDKETAAELRFVDSCSRETPSPWIISLMLKAVGVETYLEHSNDHWESHWGHAVLDSKSSSRAFIDAEVALTHDDVAELDNAEVLHCNQVLGSDA